MIAGLLLDDDMEYLRNCYMRINGRGYVDIYFGKKMHSLHRLVTNAPKGLVVDHINHNILDNRKENLRVCTQFDNKHNSRIQSNNTSGYKGVNLHKPTGKWRAQIKLNNKKYHIGLFDYPDEAAGAYMTKALELHGDFAYVG